MKTTFTFAQMSQILKTFEEKDMDPKRLMSIIASGIFADICDANASLENRNAVRKALKLESLVPEPLTITVDYVRGLQAMIKAGRYDWVSDAITPERFPVNGKEVVQFEARLFHFNRYISSEDAVKHIEGADATNPWKLAYMEHLLAFGEKFPNEQKKFPIAALNSSAKVHALRVVPYLYFDGRERHLRLHGWGHDWGEYWRGLACRKLSSGTFCLSTM